MHNTAHMSRRSLMKGLLTTTGGSAVANWGVLTHSQTIAAEAKRSGKRCIMLYTEGGVSQIDTFDMKPGRPTAGPFLPVQTNVNGIQVCEYLPNIARHADKLAIIRSMRTTSVDHGIGGYHMHTCYPSSQRFPHPEIGAMVAKYCENPESDLPSFVKIGSGSGLYGAGYLGPQFEPFVVDDDGKLPGFANPSVAADVQDRRGDLLNFMEQRFAEQRPGEPFAAHRTSELRTLRLMKARKTFDVSAEWEKAKSRYGDSSFGRACFTAFKLVEAGVSFVEASHTGYDGHNDNFPVHKANLQVLDPAWASLLQDLQDRVSSSKPLVAWTGEFGRTPKVNGGAGRDHWGNVFSTVLAGGGVRGGQVLGSSDSQGGEPKNNPVHVSRFVATMLHAHGWDEGTPVYSPDRRPQFFMPGKPLEELF